jgi:hypothetical protein
MAFIDGKSPAPQELRLAWYCKRFNALPEPGGILDQPAYLLDKMAMADNIHSAFTAYQNAKDPTAWANANPGAWELVARIEKERRFGKR